MSRPLAGATPYERCLLRYAHVPYYGVVVANLVLLILPIVVILPVSFNASSFLVFPPTGFSLRWYHEYFGRRDWVAPTILSFEVAAIVALISTAVGTLASFALVRARFRGKRFVHVLILSPMIIPVIIFAIGIYFVLSSLHLTGTVIGLVLAHTVLALPRVILIMSAVIRSFDRSLELAAMSLGASPLRTFFFVTLPIIKPGVLAATIVGFLASFDEVIVAIFISGTSAVTLPKRMWDGIQLEYDPTIAAVSSVLITGFVLVILMSALFRLRLPLPDTPAR